MISLHINIDHVATVRQARQISEPDPVTAAGLVELAGADGITIHLREDRRHIIERDVRILSETVQTRLNLEMAATAEMFTIALDIRPNIPYLDYFLDMLYKNCCLFEIKYTGSLKDNFYLFQKLSDDIINEINNNKV